MEIVRKGNQCFNCLGNHRVASANQRYSANTVEENTTLVYVKLLQTTTMTNI